MDDTCLECCLIHRQSHFVHHRFFKKPTSKEISLQMAPPCGASKPLGKSARAFNCLKDSEPPNVCFFFFFSPSFFCFLCFSSSSGFVFFWGGVFSLFFLLLVFALPQKRPRPSRATGPPAPGIQRREPGDARAGRKIFRGFDGLSGVPKAAQGGLWGCWGGFLLQPDKS